MARTVSEPALELRLLGAALARVRHGPALAQIGAKGMAVLAFLALQPGRTATRDVLVDLLWSQSAPDQGRASLRQELRRMKRAMGAVFEAAVETPGGQIALRPGAVLTDVEQVEVACDARDTAGLSALLDCYGGPFLAPLSVPEIGFQDWVAGRNSHLEARVLDAFLRLMLLDESAGRLDRAAAAARALLAIDPLQEDVHAALVRIHVAGGRVDQARRQAAACIALFEEELGEPPETDLEALIPAGRLARAAGLMAAPARGAGVMEAPARGAGLMEAPARGAGLMEAPARAPAPKARAARPAAEDPRPLVALIPWGENAEAATLAAAAADAALESLCRISWMRVRGPAGLEAAGIDVARLVDHSDYAATLRVETHPLTAELVAVARRGDAASVSARRIDWPEGGEISAAAGLGRALAGSLAADLTEAETRAALAAEAPTDPWGRLMRARGLALHGGPRSAEAARALLDPETRRSGASAEALCVLALTHLEEGWSGWSPAPREALFRGRELALRALRQALGDPWPQHVLGLAASLMEDPQAARSHQLRALTLAPGFPQATGEMARLLALSGDAEEAEAWAARALDLAPAAAEAAYWLRAPALARFARGEAEAALAAADRALAARPDWAQTRLLRAACLLELRDAAAADRTLAPALPLLRRMSPEAIRLAHPFADPRRTEALLAPLAEEAAPA